MIDEKTITRWREFIHEGVELTSRELEIMIDTVVSLQAEVVALQKSAKVQKIIASQIERSDDAVIKQVTETIYGQMDRIQLFNDIAKAADNLIYAPRTEYKPGSKKAALKDALEALKKHDESQTKDAP